MKRRDLIKRLEAAGYRVIRDAGDHTVYKNPVPGRYRFPDTGKSTK